MKELVLLLKISFKNTYNIDKIFSGKKSRLVLYALLAIYVILSLLLSFFSYAQMAADTLNKYNLISYLIVLFFVAASLMTFMLTIYNAKGNMFSAADNDLLLSMPIKSSTILASRLLYITICNLVISIFVILPAYIVYAMNTHVSFVYYIYAFLVFILLPIIPTIMASIIGYIIAYFTSKSNAKNWIEIIISFAIMGLIYFGMMKMNDILLYLSTHIDNFQNVLKWGFYPIYLVGEIFSKYDAISMLLYVVINISLFIIFTYILSINFKNIIAKLQENRSKSNYVMKELKTSSISKTLYIKEVRRYLSSPIYVFNTSFGIIMLLIAAIISIFYDKELLLKALEINSGNNNVFQLIVAGLIFIIFMTNTASASISIEGKNYWILKTLPVDPKKIFKGKIWLNVSLIVPVTLISLIILYFTYNLKLIELFVLIAITIIASFVVAQTGLLINMKFPKMNAINDVVVVKQSVSVLISILAPMAIIIGFISLYLLVSDILNFNIVVVIIFIILIIAYFVEYYLLNTWGVRRFKEIN